MVIFLYCWYQESKDFVNFFGHWINAIIFFRTACVNFCNSVYNSCQSLVFVMPYEHIWFWSYLWWSPYDWGIYNIQFFFFGCSELFIVLYYKQMRMFISLGQVQGKRFFCRLTILLCYFVIVNFINLYYI